MCRYNVFDNCACALVETLISRFKSIYQVMLCSIRYVLVYIGSREMAFTYAHCPLSKVVLLSFIYCHVSIYFFIYNFNLNYNLVLRSVLHVSGTLKSKTEIYVFDNFALLHIAFAKWPFLLLFNVLSFFEYSVFPSRFFP